MQFPVALCKCNNYDVCIVIVIYLLPHIAHVVTKFALPTGLRTWVHTTLTVFLVHYF